MVFIIYPRKKVIENCHIKNIISVQNDKKRIPQIKVVNLF
jgi:hypothetical protein